MKVSHSAENILAGRRRFLTGDVVMTALALPLALAIGVVVGVMSATDEDRARTDCDHRSQALASRYHLPRPEFGDPALAQRRLLQLCRSDPAAFAHLMRTESR
jgi:hypothetical protein